MPDDSLFAVAACDPSLLLDNATGAERARLEGATSIAFGPNSRWLAVGRASETRLIDAATGAELARLDDHNGRVAGLAFNPDGTLLAIVSTAGSEETVQSVIRLLRITS